MVKNKHKARKDASKENNNAADLIVIELITCEGLSVKLQLYDINFKEESPKLWKDIICLP